MKKQRNILRFSGLLLLFSVLFTHVFSREFSSMPAMEKAVGQCHPSDNEDKQSVDRKDQPSEEDEQPSFRQLTFEVVVPSYAFDFGVPFLACFSPRFEFLDVEELLPDINDPTIVDSYFEKLFEHHIAINAP